jgi:hypothetical protein
LFFSLSCVRVTISVSHGFTHLGQAPNDLKGLTCDFGVPDKHRSFLIARNRSPSRGAARHVLLLHGFLTSSNCSLSFHGHLEISEIFPPADSRDFPCVVFHGKPIGVISAEIAIFQLKNCVLMAETRTQAGRCMEVVDASRPRQITIRVRTLT